MLASVASRNKSAFVRRNSQKLTEPTYDTPSLWFIPSRLGWLSRKRLVDWGFFFHLLMISSRLDVFD
jgi:hypothetical protein